MTSRRINPFKLFTGSFIPNWLLKRKEISPGAKLVYARLCQYAGADGFCYPGQKSIAVEVGLASEEEVKEHKEFQCRQGRQIRRFLKELEANRLIEVERVGKKCSNRYYFLWHGWMAIDTSERTIAPLTPRSERTIVVTSERTLVPTPYKENHKEEKNHKKHICDPALMETLTEREKLFEEFWKIYPPRRGKKLNKADAKTLFIKFDLESIRLILQAVRNYKLSKTVTDGFARDAVRFLKNDFWRDWIEPEENADAERLSFIRRSKPVGKGDLLTHRLALINRC